MQPSARPTIRDIAARAGVSTATVSKVINKRYGVSAATTERVMGVIDELGYQASLVAASLRNHRTNVIGVLVADVEPFSAELLKGAADSIRGSGFELVVYSAGGRPGEHAGWERRYLSRLSGTLIDGAVVVTPTVVDVHYGSPIVAVDPHTGPSPLPTVDADNYKGAVLAAEHLLALGHRRIAMLTGRADLQSAKLREAGFRAALGEADVSIDESLIVSGDFELLTAAAAARSLLDRPDRPTALFAANDVSAAVAIDTATELGITVPEQLSVVGFDNIPESALTRPPLTTVEQPIRQMGAEAITMVMRLIRGETLPDTHITLPTQLVERASTAPAAVAESP